MRSAKCIRKVSATALGMQRHSEGRRVRAAAAGEVQKRSGIVAAAKGMAENAEAFKDYGCCKGIAQRRF